MSTSLTKHPPFKGHLFCWLSIVAGLEDVSLSDGVFCVRMVLLCPSMICVIR